jgi:hypothetical protein
MQSWRYRSGQGRDYPSCMILDSLARHAHADLLVRCETSGRSEDLDVRGLEPGRPMVVKFDQSLTTIEHLLVAWPSSTHG